jgi:hypothetical protein
MLGATRTGSLVHPVSVPPKPEELSEKGKRDWKTGVELIQTCMHTHDTATYVLGEFAVDYSLNISTAASLLKLYTLGFLVMVWMCCLMRQRIGI